MASVIIPTMRYRDAAAMIDWLCEVFGFDRNLIVADGSSGIAHAQLTLGGAMIMLGSMRDDEFGRLQVPADPGQPVNQSAYIVVSDPDRVYERAKAAGAVIVYDIRDEDYGGRGFSCRDPEGQLWNVGSYDPWLD